MARTVQKTASEGSFVYLKSLLSEVEKKSVMRRDQFTIDEAINLHKICRILESFFFVLKEELLEKDYNMDYSYLFS